MNYAHHILSEVKKAVSGKDQVLLWILTTILSRGHVLLEDVPGVGKTTVALAFSKAMGLNYGRVQFTPDVLPSDITGYTVYDKDSGQMMYRPGAVLCNLFLADELNRATSRTQSALLEAMEEGQVTVDGTSYKLPEPFFVIATQNPTGASGTQLLPDSQMDRFAIRLSIGYPSAEAELEMVQSRLSVNPLDSIRQIVSAADLVQMQREAGEVYIKDELIRYIVSLTRSTREHKLVERGASPRATISLTNLSKAVAYIQGRDFVVPEDVAIVFSKAVEHRLLLRPDAEANGVRVGQLLGEIVKAVPAPRI